MAKFGKIGKIGQSKWEAVEAAVHLVVLKERSIRRRSERHIWIHHLHTRCFPWLWLVEGARESQGEGIDGPHHRFYGGIVTGACLLEESSSTPGAPLVLCQVAQIQERQVAKEGELGGSGVHSQGC